MVPRMALLLSFLLSGCRCSRPPDPPAGPRPAAKQPAAGFTARLITVPSERLGPQPVVVLLPPDHARRAYPLLIAFSGRGEAVLAPERGAWGWVRDYHLPDQVAALRRGHLTEADFGGLVLVTGVELQRYNRSLKAAPFRGMLVACPHTFDLLGAGRLRDADYERFYLEELPRALSRRFKLQRSPAHGTRPRMGLDGVSLGGLWSLLLGFTHSEQVDQIGALQPAVTPFVDPLLELARAHRTALQRLPLSLATSTGDGLRPVVTRLSAELQRLGIAHRLTLLTGPHDYAFNRGPGGLYMLLWHDRRFQGLTL